jgi:hypothetical protein
MRIKGIKRSLQKELLKQRGLHVTEMVYQRVGQGFRAICTNVNTAAARDMGNESAAKSIDIGRRNNLFSIKPHYDI